MMTSCDAGFRRSTPDFSTRMPAAPRRSALPAVRRPCGQRSCRRIRMSLRRYYWRFVWTLGGACLREWADAMAADPTHRRAAAAGRARRARRPEEMADAIFPNVGRDELGAGAA